MGDYAFFDDMFQATSPVYNTYLRRLRLCIAYIFKATSPWYNTKDIEIVICILILGDYAFFDMCQAASHVYNTYSRRLRLCIAANSPWYNILDIEILIFILISTTHSSTCSRRLRLCIIHIQGDFA